jgi:uncharacterized protein YpuA (DUF1002 family)
MKKSIILMILVVLIISIGATYAQDVLATQKGPSQSEKGQNITIIYTITNNGNQDIFNVTVADQNFYKFFGTIKSGSKKIFTEKVYIPTDNELKEDFGDDATVSNPFFIGGIGVTYQDASGKTFGINSNSISIPLVSDKPTENIVPVNITPLASSTDSSSSGIFQQIIDLFNSILQYLQNLFTPQNSSP